MRILIAEDEVSIAKALQLMLEKNKYSVDVVHNGTDALDYICAGEYDALVLDIMMPGMDGISVLTEARRRGVTTPALFLTAKSEVEDRIAGLDAGADDYLPKPFATAELLARVRAVLRRTEKKPQEQQWQVGPLQVYPLRRQVQVNGREVMLTYKEFEILSLLLQEQGRVLTRDTLMDRVWGLEAERENRTLDVHIRTLRQKLGEAGGLIETVRGVGYKLGGQV